MASKYLAKFRVFVALVCLLSCVDAQPDEQQSEPTEADSPEKALFPKYIGQAAYGTRRVLAVLLHANDARNRFSANDFHDVLFGDQPYAMRNWYNKCSDKKLDLVPSDFGGVVEMDVDLPAKVGQQKFWMEASSLFSKQFGQLMDFSTDYVVFCYPNEVYSGSSYAATAASTKGVPPYASHIHLTGSACLKPGVILHEMGHALGLKHAGGVEDYGAIGGYTDSTDMMGGAYTGPQCFNGANLWRLGWYQQKTTTVTPSKSAPLQVKIAALVDHKKASKDEYVVVKVGDYYLKYNVQDSDEGTPKPGWKPWEQRGNYPDRELIDQVTVVKNVSQRGWDTVLYGGVGIEQHNSSATYLAPVHGIENFDGADTLYIKACSRSEGDRDHPRSMTVSIGYDPLQLCGAVRSKFGITAASTENANEKLAGGTTVLGGANIELFGAGPDEKRVALRFPSLNIPRNATITHAYVQFEGADDIDRPERIHVKIAGEKSPDSRPLAALSGDLSNRARTTASVLWRTLGWESGDDGFTERTPNLKGIIQEIVSQDGWKPRGAISLLLERFHQGPINARPKHTLLAWPEASLVITYDYPCRAGAYCPSELLPDELFQPGSGSGAGQALYPIEVAQGEKQVEAIALPGVRAIAGGSKGSPAAYAFDGNTSTKWNHDLTFDSRPIIYRSPPNQPWVQYQLAEAQAYSSYQMVLSNNPARSPSGWRLYGYDGLRWDLLDRQVVSKPAPRQNVYAVENGGRYYRYHFVFDVGPDSADPFLEINEISLKQQAIALRPLQEFIGTTFVVSNFEAAAVATRLFGELELSGTQFHTLFIPWNSAFESLPYWQKVTRPRPWRGHLREMLLGHVTEGDIPKEDLRDGLEIPMLNGDTALISQTVRPKLDGIAIIGNSWASDGYAHIIQNVREPAWSSRTILQVVNDPNQPFAKISNILMRPGMEDIYALLSDQTSGVTFFAPTDTAMTGELYNCAGSACADMVRRYITDSVFSRRYTPSTTLVMRSGLQLRWVATDQTVSCTRADGTIQNANVAALGEQLAVNGVVQPIGALLCSP